MYTCTAGYGLYGRKMKMKKLNAQINLKRVPKSNRPCLKREMAVEITCTPIEGDCERCGWNPEVERERLERIRGH